MTAYRLGSDDGYPAVIAEDQLVVVFRGSQGLAERICELLNAQTNPECPWGSDCEGDGCSRCGWRIPGGTRDSDAPCAPRVRRQSDETGSGVPTGTPDVQGAPEAIPADSCTCVYRPNGGTDPDCVVHQGRRARGPKPPPVGPGCVCDGSGRTCPRHGAVI